MLCVFCCCYSLFAYTCKSSKGQCKKTKTSIKTKNKNTGHPPAHHSTANKYLSGSGWMSCIFLCFLVLSLRLCYLCFVVIVCVCCCIVFLSCCMYKRKNYSKNKKQKRLREKLKRSTAHPAGTWEIFIRGRVVGWRMSCLFLCFRVVYLSCRIYNRKNTSKNIVKRK